MESFVQALDNAAHSNLPGNHHLPMILAVKYLLQNVWRKIRQKMTSEFFCQTLGVSTSAAPAFSRRLGQQFSPPLRLPAPTHVLPGGPLKVTSLLAIFLEG